LNGAVKTVLVVGAAAGAGYVIWQLWFRQEDSTCGAIVGVASKFGLPEEAGEALCGPLGELVEKLGKAAGGFGRAIAGTPRAALDTVGKVVRHPVRTAKEASAGWKGIVDVGGNLFGGDGGPNSPCEVICREQESPGCRLRRARGQCLEYGGRPTRK
jgi:hypothetical protein